MNISTKEKYTQTQRIDVWLPRGSRVGKRRNGSLTLANANYCIYCRMDKRGPTIQYRELYSILCDKSQKNTYIYLTESLCYTEEINTTL